MQLSSFTLTNDPVEESVRASVQILSNKDIYSFL
jgi:hypothetical protein